MKAYEVDLYEYSNERGGELITSEDARGCDKMSLCGSVEQTKTLIFRAVDNLQREGAVVTALVHMDQSNTELPVTRLSNESYTYEFAFVQDTTGVGILEVFVNLEQIPESPFRVQIIDRDCNTDYPGKGKTAVGPFACAASDFCILTSCSFIVVSSLVQIRLSMARVSVAQVP